MFFDFLFKAASSLTAVNKVYCVMAKNKQTEGRTSDRTFYRLSFFIWILVILFPVSAFANKTIGEIKLIKGPATVFRQGVSKPMTAVRGMPLFLNDQVKTGPDSRLRLAFKDGSYMAVGENANLYLDQFDFDVLKKERKVIFRVTAGKFKIFVKSLKKFNNRTFQIMTPTTAINVLGTVYMVWVVDQTITRVICFQGALDVRNHFDPSQYVNLIKGLATDVIKDLPPSKPVLLNEKQMQEFQKSLGETTTTTTTTSTTTTSTTTTTTTTTSTTTTEPTTTTTTSTTTTITEPTLPTSTTTTTTTTTTSSTTSSTLPMDQ